MPQSDGVDVQLKADMGTVSSIRRNGLRPTRISSRVCLNRTSTQKLATMARMQASVFPAPQHGKKRVSAAAWVWEDGTGVWDKAGRGGGKRV